MSTQTQVIYEFYGFRLDPQQRLLLCNGEPVSLAPKGFDTLLFLVQNSGRIVEKDELMKALWPESFVEEGNLAQNIFVLRKTLGDESGNAYIKTVPRRGYKFIAPVRLLDIPAQPPQSPLPAEYWSTHSPFRGLQVFESSDAWLFFGRKAETEELLLRLTRSPIVVVIGNSGCGKSSLVRAGIIPALPRGFVHRGDQPSEPLALSNTGATKVGESDTWRVAIVRPSVAPFDYLADVLPHQLAPELDVKRQAEFIADCRSKLPLGGETLRNAISALAHAADHQSRDARVLLVVDQFEELFTLTTDPQIRERYINTLLAASRWDSSVPVHLILIIRADFYTNCLEHAGLSRCLEDNLYNVPRMTGQQLRESIEKRLALAGARAESGLVDSLLDDVGMEPGNLALLEHALSQMWERVGRFGSILTSDAYSAIGRLRGALSAHADEVYGEIADEPQRRLVRNIFLELVYLGDGAPDTRRRVRKADLLSLGEPERIELLLARLTSSRLVSITGEQQESFVEVSHEALIREWSTLHEWITQSREELRLGRRLTQSAEEWKTLNCDPGALLRGARLAQGEEWLAVHPAAPAIVQDFVHTSINARMTAEERELRKQKAHATRLRWLSSLLAFALLVALGAVWIAVRQQLIAVRQQLIAVRQQLIERSHALAAQSRYMLTRDRGQALDLAIRSWRTAQTEEAEIAIAASFPEPIATLNHESPVERTIFSPNGKRIIIAGGNQGAQLLDAEGHLLAVLQPNAHGIEGVAFSPEGERLVTVSSDQRAQIWKTADGTLIATLGASQPKGRPDFEATTSGRVTFSPDGTRIATTGWDNTVKLWSVHDGRLLTVLKGHTGTVVDVAFSPDGKHIVTASWDHTARTWSSDGQPEFTLAGHTQIVLHAEFSHDSRQILTTSADRTARIWKSADGGLVAVLAHDGIVTDGAFAPHDNQIVTVSEDHTARLWNSANGHLLFSLKHDGPVNHAHFSPDGRYIATASNDQLARVWSAANGRRLALLQGHSDAVNDASFSPDGRSIATGSNDGTFRLWHAAAGGLMVTSLRGHRGTVTHAEFSTDGKHVVTSSKDGTTGVWSVHDGHQLKILQESAGAFAHFSPDGQRILDSSKDRVRLWELASGKLIATLQGHSLKAWNAAFAPDGSRIVTASTDKTAQVWSSSDGRTLLTLQGHRGDVYHAAYSPDGAYIVTASADHTALIWNSLNGQVTATLQGHSDRIWTAAFSPDSRYVVTASYDHTARLWRSIDGRLLATLQHTDVVDAAQFSSDGRYIVTASWDGTARIWHATDGQPIATLRGHANKIIAAAFSPNSRYIVTASSDHTAKVWTVPDFALLATLQGHAHEVWDAAFSPDSQYVVTASLDQTARIWRLLTLDDIDAILAK